MNAAIDSRPTRRVSSSMMRKQPTAPTSAVNWPALLVLWAVALAFVLLGQ